MHPLDQGELSFDSNSVVDFFKTATLPLLDSLFAGRALLSDFVANELRAADIQWPKALLVSLTTEAELQLFEDIRRNNPALGAGEVGAIAVCRLRGARLISNDRQARRAAEELGIPVSGSMAVLRYGVDACRCAHDIDVKIEVEKIDYDKGLLWFKQAKNRPAPPKNLSLIPDEIFNAAVIAESIERLVRHYRVSGQLPEGLRDFLFRLPARISGHAGGPLLAAESNLLSAVTGLVSRMDSTTLFIQGPPGCGKTFTGGEVIAALLSAGKRVGVTSNSHRAISLLLKSVAQSCDRLGVQFRGAKAGYDEDQEQIHRSIELLLGSSGEVFKQAVLPDLVGGTAWVFARAEAEGKFDYLFVDEAGQVSLANLVGMASAARNVVLLGDQMQLNQPMQGVHPGESGQSVLEYLLEGAATVPPELGVLLPNTWRMRPEVCAFISDAIYEGKISSHPGTLERYVKFAEGPRSWINRESGLIYIPVTHSGNTYESDEEVEVIKQIVAEVSQHSLHVPGQTPRKIAAKDLLVVAPFNLQVRRLQSVLPGVRVGTVDKFQGQEAPIVIFSMTASDGNASPRGIEFLFSRNRLNVAVSRAQILAIVVGSPRLVRTRCNHLGQIELVNLFCRVVESGTTAFGVPA